MIVTDRTPTASDAVAVIGTVPVTCPPLAGDVIVTEGAFVSAADPMTTVTADRPTFPAASRASARIVCDPFAASLLFQRALYGAFVSVPTTAPSTRNVTDVTPTASAAFAMMLTLRATCSPGAGDVMLTAGGVVSDCAASGDCDPTASASAVTAIILAASELIWKRPAEQQCCHVHDYFKCAGRAGAGRG